MVTVVGFDSSFTSLKAKGGGETQRCTGGEGDVNLKLELLIG